MSELASYSIQAIFFALVAVVVVSRSKKTDLYQLALISIWLIGVIAIYARYREGQVLFYSNDQDFHKLIIDYYIPIEGIHLNAFFGLRYVLTIPVYLVSLLGFNAMLILKFIQLVFLLLTYRQARMFLLQGDISVRFWHIMCIAGPITIFTSLLSLRDLILSYCAVAVMANPSLSYRVFAIGLVLCLRPHLAVALVFGLIAAEIFTRIQKTKPIIYVLMFSVFSYALGCLAFPVGLVIQHNAMFEGPAAVFSQLKFSQLAINFIGLQFLALNDENGLIVAQSTFSLLLSRLVFFDTFVIPILFLKSAISRINFLTKEKILVLMSFLFFYGVVSQTTWNSTRQNIPFLACMGLLAVADIEHFRKIKAKAPPKLLMASR